MSDLTAPVARLLMAQARSGSVLTYGEVAAAVGTVARVVPMVLQRIQGRCLNSGLPDLSSLVVNRASGRPGGTFFAPYDLGEADVAARATKWAQARAAVQAHDWLAHPLD